VIAYLEQYAAHFGIVPRTGESVRAVSAVGDLLEVESNRDRYLARVVVIAAGFNRVPSPDRLPEQERFRGVLLHSARYADGTSFRGQRVLVVGMGNTGAEIALDLLEHGATPTISFRTAVNVVPRDFLGMPTQVTSLRLRNMPDRLVDGIGRLVSRLAFGDLTPYGLPRPELGPLSAIKIRGRIPLIDVGTINAVKRGEIAVAPAVQQFTEQGVIFVGGKGAAFDAVVLATGYRAGLDDFVRVPGALDEGGYPRDWKGGGAHPGLYFVGYLNVATGLLREIGLQAEAVAGEVATRR
jgi:cation diffusion facilitator CzcD-associated flavoprotein CzcO